MFFGEDISENVIIYGNHDLAYTLSYVTKMSILGALEPHLATQVSLLIIMFSHTPYRQNLQGYLEGGMFMLDQAFSNGGRRAKSGPRRS